MPRVTFDTLQELIRLSSTRANEIPNLATALRPLTVLLRLILGKDSSTPPKNISAIKFCETIIEELAEFKNQDNIYLTADTQCAYRGYLWISLVWLLNDTICSHGLSSNQLPDVTVTLLQYLLRYNFCCCYA